MTNPLYTIETLPADDQAALREFVDRYIAAIGAAPAPTWADAGDQFPTSSPMLTFPVSSFALKYLQTEGESRFKTLLSKSFDMKVQEFDVGVQAKLLDLTNQIFAYRAWQQGPARMLIAEQRRRNEAIAALLEDGENAQWGTGDGIDGENFFSAAHLSDFNNPASTQWSNYQVSAKPVVSITNLQVEVTAMQGTLDENGKKLGAYPTHIMVPTATYEPLKNLLSQNFMLAGGTSTSVTSAATSNPYLNRFEVVHNPDLTDANDWYLIDANLRSTSGLPPWISVQYTKPNPSLQLRTWDESSDFFKDTGCIKVSSHIWRGDALAFPHSIRKIKGA